MLKNISCVLLVLLALWAGPVRGQNLDPDHPYHTQDDRLLVIAHRGGGYLYPENTMIAFRHAVELGVDVLELDVRSTADGVLVAIHDATVNRTTNGTGPVDGYTFQALQQLDAGYDWVDVAGVYGAEERFRFRGQGITIPALRDVLAAFPEMVFSIEIKQSRLPIARPLCDMLYEHAMIDQVVVNAANVGIMTQFRVVCPDAYIAGKTGELRQQLLFVMSDVLTPTTNPTSVFHVSQYYRGVEIATPVTVRLAHSAGIGLYVWTINDPETMRRLIAMDVDGIITDRPDLLLDVLGRLG